MVVKWRKKNSFEVLNIFLQSQNTFFNTFITPYKSHYLWKLFECFWKPKLHTQGTSIFKIVTNTMPSVSKYLVIWKKETWLGMSIVHSKRHHFDLITQLETIKLNCLLNMYLYPSLNASSNSQSFLHGRPCRVMPLYLLRHKRKFPNETKASISCLKPLPLHHSIGALSITVPNLGENTNIAEATPLRKNLLLPRDFRNVRGRRERWKNHYWHSVFPEQHSLPASLKAIAHFWDGESPPFPKFQRSNILCTLVASTKYYKYGMFWPAG